MAKNLAETQAEMANLRTAITEEKAGVVALTEAIDKLIAAGPGAGVEDLTPLFDEVVAAKDELLGNDADVQSALDKVTPPTPPVV